MPTAAPSGLSGAAPALFQSDLRLPGFRRGKVRDVYDLPAEGNHPPRLLIIATDRISAFDVVMPTSVPGKGRILTALSLFWLEFIKRAGLSQTHIISTRVADIPASAFAGSSTTPADLEGRIMIARRCRVIPIECVARGYLEGSGWKEYQALQSVCGIRLPAGLKQCDRLPEPIFTPATKEEQGKHDENIDFATASKLAGGPLMEYLRRTTLAIYTKAADHARSRGIIIADTKFEFGIPDGAPSSSDPIIIDEALTPDSSRFWPADTYSPGRPQKSYDKQYLREYLETLVASGTWNKQAPGPQLPDHIIAATLDKYSQALTRLTA